MARGGEMPARVMSSKWIAFLCVASFCVGLLFTNRMWNIPEAKDVVKFSRELGDQLKLVSEGCDPKLKPVASRDYLGEVSKTDQAIETLGRTISNLEMELAAARAAQASILTGSPISEDPISADSAGRTKAFMVIGINTAFSSRKRRDSVRTTWMPRGERRRKMEEKGIIVRFVIGHSATAGGILDRAIEAEDSQHGDFMRLEHVEGYHELSAKTKIYFATAVSKWDGEIMDPPHYQRHHSNPKSLLSLAAFCVRASENTPKDVDPTKIAANLVALLGSEEEVRSVDPDLARELLACLRFLVPHNVSLPYDSYQPGFQSGNRKLMKKNVELFPQLGFEQLKFESRKLRVSVQDEKVNKLIRWPPGPVMELARSAVEWVGDPGVIQQALNPTHYQVPNFEESEKHKCQLTRTSFGRRFMSKELNLYMAFLFETIASLAPSAGFNVSLNRYDLFHGHLFLASNTGRLGILFHAKEYPAFNKETFPFHLGYCQAGSNLPYDDAMNLRNILWLAPMPDCSNITCVSKWLAPGVLVVLDAHPKGIIYNDLVGEWVQDVRTIYEDDFGDAIVDVNYLNVETNSSENKIFIC